MFLQPAEILICACGVYDEQKRFISDSIRDQVIDDAAPLIKEERVLAHSDTEFVDVVCEHRVEPLSRAQSIDNKLAHVRNIEDADVVSHCLMFLNDAGVLHRHEPSGEGNHFRAQPHVLVVKRCFFGCGFAHGPSLDSDKCGASVSTIGDWLDFDSSPPYSPRSTRRGEIASRFPGDERLSSPPPPGSRPGGALRGLR